MSTDERIEPDTATAPGPDRPALRAGAIVGGAVAVGTAALVAIDPTDSGVPVCWSQAALGIDCPLCGGLRCVNALARGDFLAAADHNVVLAVALPLLTIAWLAWMVSAWRGQRLRLPRVPAWLIGVGLASLVAFSVARNLDANAFTTYLGATAS